MANVRGLLLDVEGVLVGDKRYRAVPGAVDFMRRVRAAGLPVSIITNNTTDTKAVLVERLRREGLDFTLAEAHTCIGSAIHRLRTLGARRCLVLGTLELRQMFLTAGFEVMNESAVDAVIVGLDTELTYERLRLACDAVGRRRAAFLALHRNRVYTDAFGRLAPSVGAIVEAIVFATEVEPTVIGKPSREYFQQALNSLGVEAGDVLMVSDDPLTDLVGAKQMGMQTAFVLSGKYKEPKVLEHLPPEQRPDHTAAGVADLLAGGVVPA
ncbi:MAG TPA: HAD-IIA family hydrolase [Phycisphaerae bacterium]|nr:HAD-IIA family hydrolase [Phycisphaerae bacterium]HNU47029.1 HAD-IIA family hydrolase [Phycisphaerae bacterium]